MTALKKKSSHLKLESKSITPATLELWGSFRDAIGQEKIKKFKEIGDEILKTQGGLDIPEGYGEHFLLMCCKYLTPKSLKMMKYLLEWGVNSNIADKKGDTALHYVVSKYSHDFDLACQFISLLIKHGAKLDQPNKPGDLPQHLIFEGRDTSQSLKMMNYLFDKGIDIDVKGWSGISLLHGSITVRNEACAQFLLHNGANVDCLTASQRTPLHLAALYGDLEIAQLLIDFKANINSGAGEFQTPLFNAFRAGSLEVFKLLVEQGASLIILNSKGENIFSEINSPNPILQAFYEQKVLEMSLPHHSNPNKIQTPRL